MISLRTRLDILIDRFRVQSRTKKIFFSIGAISLGLVTGVFLLFSLTWLGLLGHLPSEQELLKLEHPLATEIYSADSVLLGKYCIEERSDLAYEKIPQHVVDALLATEDSRFFKHSGIDYRSLIRVLIKSILLLDDNAGGGSTLTQQLAKNLFPRKNYWLLSLPVNKIREMIIAARLEKAYDKQSLVALYLNTVSFGDGSFGLETASQRFFSKPATEISIDEGALLIGMLKATSVYNPRNHPDRAKARRNIVLTQMAKYEKLSLQKIDSLKELPLKLKYNKVTTHDGLAPYFREYIKKELLDWCQQQEQGGEVYNLYTDGLKVYTTIDSRLQRYAEEAVRNKMTKLQSVFDEQWKGKDFLYLRQNLFADKIKTSARYLKLQAGGKSHNEIIEELQKPELMNLFTWQGEKEVMMSPIDSIKHYLRFLNTGLLAMEPNTGAVRVWVGGINHRYFEFDHVKESTKRQVGSAFKPVVYAAALESGQRPCAFISAEKTNYQNVSEITSSWSPGNTEKNYHLKYSMEGAMAFSVNTVAVHALEKTGIDSTISIARKLGIESDLPNVPSLALGTADISVIEMVTAYSAFVNEGWPVKPYFITSVCTSTNKIIEKLEPEVSDEPAISETNAQLMVHMLMRTINEGTAVSIRNVYHLPNEMAGKTGTTQSNADGWFMAMTPKLVVGTWVGADNRGIRFRSGAFGSGATTALPITAEFFRKINSDESLAEISEAKFPELSNYLQRKLNCDLYKDDTNFFEKIFGKAERDSVRKFGEPKSKKGFFKKLFPSR